MHKKKRLEKLKVFYKTIIVLFLMSILIVKYDIGANAKALEKSETQITSDCKEKRILKPLIQQNPRVIAEFTPPKIDMRMEPVVKVGETRSIVEESVPEETYDIEENISEWFLSNEYTEENITVWKKSDEKGLLVAIKNQQDELLSVFLYPDINGEYEEWTKCDEYLSEITTADIVDISFVAYHEVSGNNSANVQAQAAVIANRVASEQYENNVHGVVTEGGQYACKQLVINRRLKSKNFLEEEDLEKCFRQVLLVCAGEIIEEVPNNVVYAAAGPQGSGIWKIIDGTYYCYE